MLNIYEATYFMQFRLVSVLYFGTKLAQIFCFREILEAFKKNAPLYHSWNWIANHVVWAPPSPTGYLFPPPLPPLQYSLHNVRLIASAISSPSSPKWVLRRHQHVWKERRGGIVIQETGISLLGAERRGRAGWMEPGRMEPSGPAVRLSMFWFDKWLL